MDKYFYRAGDLDNIKDEKVPEEIYFRRVGDFDNPNNEQILKETNTNISDSDIKNYLENTVSGITYDYENEFGTICSEGNIIISFNQLQDMLDTGEYNIISANFFNKNMIEIKYQQFDKKNKTKSM